MTFQILGPLAASLDDGEAIDLGPRKQRELLALLLINANEVLPVERVIEELWGDDGDGKENSLRVHVSRLRSALDPERTRGDSSMLETVAGGYRLSVAPEDVDAAAFEALAARGRRELRDDPDAAAETLSDALGLWHGDAMADFAYDDFAQLEIKRLEDLRVDVIEDRIEADLARGLAGELVSEIEVLRERHPLRERLVESQALALYRAGRAADALRAIDRFRRHVGEELGIDPSPQLLRLEEQVLLHDERIQPRRREVAVDPSLRSEATNPFNGLHPFGTDDADRFHGRDALVAELLRTMADNRLVALVGASGSGKSSVIRAGLVPALAKGAVEGSDRWLVATMVPGAHPFAELEAALLRTTLDAPDSLTEQLQDNEAGVLRAALRVLPSEDSRLVVIIDQFEELFTLVDSHEVRRRFLSNLVTAADEPHGRITVVVTLRADYYSETLSHPEFGARLGSGIVNVTPLTSEDLEAAATRPAEQVGVAIEPPLLGQLISDVGNQPGALPLFQYALTELFDRRSADTLTIATYRAMGGLAEALQRRAEELVSQLDPDEEEATRQLFLRLVTIGQDEQRNRRRVPAREIASLGVDTVTMQEVIAQFGARRLLAFDSDRLTGAPTVEVAHEALLTSWPTLEAWIDESREDLQRHASLATAVREWELAGEDPAYLLTESRLEQIDASIESSSITLNAPERAYLEVSRRHIAQARAAEAERLRLERRSRRRLAGVIGVLVVAIGGFGALWFTGVIGPEDRATITFFGDRAPGSGAIVAAGLDRAAEELDFDLVTVDPVADVPGEFRELAAGGAEIAISHLFGPPMDEIPAEFPDTRFGFTRAPPLGHPNATSVQYSDEHGGYLAGVAAALATETGVVGFVGLAPAPPFSTYLSGFQAGVAATDPDVEVLVTLIDQFGLLGPEGAVGRPDLADARVRALHQRGVDVTFLASTSSNDLGAFDAISQLSAETGQHLWAIGVEVDQWFSVRVHHRPHVLTSIVKRFDNAAFALTEHLLGDEIEPTLTLGAHNGGFDYSQRNERLPADVRTRLDQVIAEFDPGRLAIPTEPSGAILFVDTAGNAIDGPDQDDAGRLLGVDGIELNAPLPHGTHDIGALGTPLSFTTGSDWITAVNQPGEMHIHHPDSAAPGDRNLAMMRPLFLTDATQPDQAIDIQTPWPLDDIDGWLDQLVDGINVSNRASTVVGGRSATYFELELRDSQVCGDDPKLCAHFIQNDQVFSGTFSGWTLQPGINHRIWWVDGGEHQPVVVIAATVADDDDPRFYETVDALLATMTIGDSQPHPITEAAGG